MPSKRIGTRIDKLTNSIEHAASGVSFPTEIQMATPADLRALKQGEWLFDWPQAGARKDRQVYKLVTCEAKTVIHGLICLQDKGDHIFMHLIENSRLNKGAGKEFLGVAGNLIAYACKVSFDRGYDGYVSFESKTRLISHYQSALGASLLFGNVMVIEQAAAARLVRQYFP